ncbi:MAG: prepilin peptidase [Pseudomonadota bacterium]
MVTAAIVYLIKSCVIGLLCWALWSDTQSYKIPNKISLALIGLYPAWVMATWPMVDPLGGLMIGGIFLAIGFALFATGVVGGGDAKLMAAFGLWVGPTMAVQFLFLTAVAGGGLALTIFLYACGREQIWRNASWGTMRAIGAQPIPYGIAIALGGLAVLFQLPIGGAL